MTSVNTWTKSLLEIVTDTRKHLHKELDLMIQVETQMMKNLTDTTRQGLEAKIVEAEAWVKHGYCQRTGTGADP
jgi:hypothetical protein